MSQDTGAGIWDALVVAARQLERVVRPVRRKLAHDRALDGVMLGLAAITGFATGVFAWLLLRILEFVVDHAWSSPVPWWQLLLVPTLGGLVVGLWTSTIAPEARGGGVVVTMETITLRGGRFRLRVPFVATPATAVALGTGASGGPEGPIVMIGGAVGSILSRIVPIGEDRTRALVAAGAAAGIGASFNAPIGGMLFAIELLLGGIRRAGSLQVVVVAAVVGSVTARQLVGEGLTFRPAPGLGLGSPEELMLYAGLGIAAAVIAYGFRTGHVWSIRFFRPIERRFGRIATAGVGGLGVGVIALALPEVLGDGSELPDIGARSDPIQAMLDGVLATGWLGAGMLVLLAFAKVVATSLSKGSGAPVGIFAPTLFTGAALGGAFGIAASELFTTDVRPAAFALVGMAAVLAATARAPLTAILLVFELTGSYGLVLPLMVAVGVAIAVEELRGTDSIYVQELREKGILYGATEDLDVLQTVRVGEVMTRNHPTVRQDLPITDLVPQFSAAGSDGFAVVDDDGRLVGMVTRRDLDREGTTVADICTRQVVTVEADDPVFRAVRRMGTLDVGRIPVVDPQTRHVVGMVRRADIVRAYQRGIDRSLGAQQRGQADRLRDLTGVRFVELVIDTDSPAVGRTVADIAWPERTVVTSIRRRGTVVVPTGATAFEPGDELVVLTGHGEALYAALNAPRAGHDVGEPPAE
ncbi:MAG: chloride channel protein [Nitriliruptoraceae bacterium]